MGFQIEKKIEKNVEFTTINYEKYISNAYVNKSFTLEHLLEYIKVMHSEGTLKIRETMETLFEIGLPSKEIIDIRYINSDLISSIYILLDKISNYKLEKVYDTFPKIFEYIEQVGLENAPREVLIMLNCILQN